MKKDSSEVANSASKIAGQTKIEFTQAIGRQFTVNRRAEFTVPNSYRELLEKYNEFPSSYIVIINNDRLAGTMYKNPRPYYYFKILTTNIDKFFNFIEDKNFFNVEFDLDKKEVRIS
jgi:hypothetical protein